MKIWFLFFAVFFLFSCDNNSASDSAGSAEKQVTDYVVRPGLSLPFSTDTMAMLAKTIGKPIAFSGSEIRFVDNESVFNMPLDSVLARIDKPSYFRNPEEKLSAFWEGDLPKAFAFDLYDPYPDTWVDSISLSFYKLDYDYEDMSSRHEMEKMYSHLDQGNARLIIQNQCKKEVAAFELGAKLKKRIKSGANCVVEPFSRTFIVNKLIPPLTQIHTTIQSDSLAMDLVCNRAQYFEVPYKAEFSLLRYQLKGDTTWIDARKREVIVD